MRICTFFSARLERFLAREPVTEPANPLKEASDMWWAYGRKLPGFKEAFDIIRGGYRVEPSAPLEIEDSEFPRCEGERLASVLRTLEGLLDAGKLLGPFKPYSVPVKHFVTSFLVPKNGKVDEVGCQLYRFIVNGSKETLLSPAQADKVERWIARQDPARLRHTLSLRGGLEALVTTCKRELGLKTTLNDFLPKVPMQLDSAKEIIRGLKHCNYIGKIDLKKGFRQIVLHESSFDHLVVKIYMRATPEQPWTEVWFKEVTAVMGLRPSPPEFNKIPALFVRMLVFHFRPYFVKGLLRGTKKRLDEEHGEDWDPETVAGQVVEATDPETARFDQEQFDKDFLLRLVRHYLDDVVLGEEFVKMAHLQFHISLKFGEKRLKVEFNRKKLDFPDTIQIVLGVWVDQARQLVGLKPGYAPALVEQIDEVVHALRTESRHRLRLGEKLLGKLVFSGTTLLPRMASLRVAFNEVMTALKACGRVERGLRDLATAHLLIIKRWLQINGEKGPLVPRKWYLDEFRDEATPSWTDASGFEEAGNGGYIGGYWAPKQFGRGGGETAGLEHMLARPAGEAHRAPTNPEPAHGAADCLHGIHRGGHPGLQPGRAPGRGTQRQAYPPQDRQYQRDFVDRSRPLGSGSLQ